MAAKGKPVARLGRKALSPSGMVALPGTLFDSIARPRPMPDRPGLPPASTTHACRQEGVQCP